MSSATMIAMSPLAAGSASINIMLELLVATEISSYPHLTASQYDRPPYSPKQTLSSSLPWSPPAHQGHLSFLLLAYTYGSCTTLTQAARTLGFPFRAAFPTTSRGSEVLRLAIKPQAPAPALSQSQKRVYSMYCRRGQTPSLPSIETIRR